MGPGNGYSGIVSAEAAGIIACLYVYGNLQYADKYWDLREYAYQLPEAAKILAAID